MLRRKLLLNLGPLVLLLLFSAMASIYSLQQTLAKLSQSDAAALAEHVGELASFRHTVIGLTIVFLIVINLSVAILLHVAGSILRPVDKLVDATRQLADGRFGHRVDLNRSDEFGELAAAFNGMAERLGRNEQQQMQTLAQVALAMNHEINNSIAIIELQLKLLSRQSNGGPAPQKYLTQIEQSLRRMTDTVRALQSARRIVLTDYLPGVKMLDLARSQLADDGDTDRACDGNRDHAGGEREHSAEAAVPGAAGAAQSAGV